MEIYKKATRKKLRFQTAKGLFSIEQVWGMSMSALEAELKSLNKEINEQSTGSLDFLDGNDTVDPDLRLRFNIMKDIYLTKKAELDKAAKAKETREHNQRVMEAYYKAKNKELENKNPEEILKEIKEEPE